MGSSSYAPTPPDWRHDVFVSYRGEDTRKGFASHLFHALKQADIRCYRDIERQERGQVVGPMLVRAIRSSRIAIIIFSANYADSKWCLQELVEILKCNKIYRDHGHMVIPIFYGVEPSEVRRQSGKFGEGFERCRTGDEKEKESWRAALEEAGNISAWHLDTDARDEAEFTELIVQELSNKVFYFHSPYHTDNVVGLDQNVDHLISLLNIESDNVLMIGICGMEGIGKTTIVKAVCSRLYNKFQGISLLEDIQHADDEHKFVKLQKQLLQNILKIRNVMFLSNRRTNNISIIRSRLDRKKMLLVLDNLDNKEQAYSITGEHDFLGPGSRILITTRDEQLLDDLRVDEKFMIQGLNAQDSLQLFCNHAFAQGSPRKGYEKLSKDLVHYVGGIPLAIETFASFLSGKTKDELQQVLKKLIKDPHLDSIGVYLRSTTSLHSFKCVGPYGGTGDRFDDNAHTSIRKILVFAERVINSIIIEYDHDGSLVRSSVHGKLDPLLVHSIVHDKLNPLDCTGHMVTLDYPNEFLISISGYIAEHYGFRVIRSLKFQSNKRLYGPFGEETGTYFTFPTVDNGRIIGLFGNCDDEFVDSIGAYFGPIPQPYLFNSLGPTNGEGKTWDDKKHMDIRQIEVVFSSEIESISVVYDNYGHPLGPITHGRDVGGEKRTVKLDYPDEYLISISGYTYEVSGAVRVRSLTFQSNRRKHGPFGQETGMHFPSQWSGGKIVGFFGTIEDSHLRSIRAHLEPVSHIHPYKDAGPFGGECGRHWDDENLGSIKRIVITWGEVIHSIKCDGSAMEGITHGGSGGSNEQTIELRCPNEYINMISGNYKEVGGDIVIVCLTFRSNLMTHGPYGGQENASTTYFRTPWNIGMINGFFGRSGNFLNSIGAHFAPVYHKIPLKIIGPFGDDTGDQWDDGVHGGVREINLRSGYIIDAIDCIYGDGEDVVKGSSHGGAGGYQSVLMQGIDKDDSRESIASNRVPIIKLDYPNEYVRSISGHFGKLGHYMCIRSLTFKTNRKTYGPYGREVGTPFSFESDDSKIVGFFGSSSKYLHSIGAHVEALPY